MIPMSCPNCGRRGNVPPDRLNSRLHCKKCDAVFHMDSTGKIVLGDPAEKAKKAAAAKASKTSQATKAAAARRKSGKGKGKGGSESPLAAIPGPVKAALVVLPVLGLVVWLGLKVVSGMGGPPVPDSVEDRSKYVALAFVDKDLERLDKVAAPGTEPQVAEWVEKHRDEFGFAGPQQPGKTVTAFVDGTEVDPNAGTGRTQVRLLSPELLPDGSTERYRLDLYWVTNEKKTRWVLDGKKTLEMAPQNFEELTELREREKEAAERAAKAKAKRNR